MSQKGAKNKDHENKNQYCLRGLLPSTQRWLKGQISEDQPTIPKVIKKNLEDAQRREVEGRARKQ